MSADRHSIITLPHENLRQRSKRVGFVNDDIKKVIEDMKSSTLDWEAHREHEFGVALAAVQIDQLYRIVIIRSDLQDKSNTDFAVFINPEITKQDGEIVEDYEGCLSIKDLYGKVPRYSRVKVKALNEEGREFRVTAEGFMARVFQHEIDHTNGIVYVDHIKDKDAFYNLNEDGKLEKLDHDEILASDILW